MTHSFSGILLQGHKGAAVEVPFDPAEQWSRAAQPLWPGRRGHRALAVLNGVRFETAIVSRSKRFWLLVGENAIESAAVGIGQRVKIAVDPAPARAVTPVRAPSRRSSAAKGTQRSSNPRRRR